jgi:small conductance mechanosensitive channel
MPDALSFDNLALLVLRIGAAAVTILITRRLAVLARIRMGPILARAELSPSLATLATVVTFYAIWVVGMMIALVFVGVPIDTVFFLLVAVLVVVGVALQQSLRDLAATINFIFFKHFEAGDLVETNGVLGTVREIELLNTTILKADQTLAVLPNGKIQENGLLNYSKMGILRLDSVVTISYEDDLLHAKEVLRKLLVEDRRILDDPKPLIVVLALGENGVDIGVRPYVKAADYWQVGWDLTEAVKLRFDKEGITIPYPQRDVHTKQGSSGAE